MLIGINSRFCVKGVRQKGYSNRQLEPGQVIVGPQIPRVNRGIIYAYYFVGGCLDFSNTAGVCQYTQGMYSISRDNRTGVDKRVFDQKIAYLHRAYGKQNDI